MNKKASVRQTQMISAQSRINNLKKIAIKLYLVRVVMITNFKKI